MEAKDNPAYLTVVAQAVVDFRHTLEAFLELNVVNQEMARGLAPSLVPSK